jgi:hypothetical protein
MRIICLFLFGSIIFACQAGAQVPVAGQARPSAEEFVNDIFLQLGDTSSTYYLVMGADTCRFEKFDYDEWVKYHLEEKVPLVVLNELAYKVHLAGSPYYWQQDKLKNAVCINARQADSLFERPVHTKLDPRIVFSFSQPQFTDDGQYAVIDVNCKTGLIKGTGYTLLFRRDRDHWRHIGQKQNWGSNQ